MTGTGNALGPRIIEDRSEPSNATSGDGQFNFARVDAEEGSSILLERLTLAFDRFAYRHGVSAEEARILLLDTGVRL